MARTRPRTRTRAVPRRHRPVHDVLRRHRHQSVADDRALSLHAVGPAQQSKRRAKARTRDPLSGRSRAASARIARGRRRARKRRSNTASRGRRPANHAAPNRSRPRPVRRSGNRSRVGSVHWQRPADPRSRSAPSHAERWLPQRNAGHRYDGPSSLAAGIVDAVAAPEDLVATASALAEARVGKERSIVATLKGDLYATMLGHLET